jgi:hypothetical protein
MLIALLALCLPALDSGCDPFRGHPPTLEAVPDLDLDGIEDLIWIDRRQGHEREWRRSRALALSGADGTVLWEIEIEDGSCFGREIAGVGDVDGDGRSEVCISSNEAIAVHKGIDGTLLWSAAGNGVLVTGLDWNDDGLPDVYRFGDRVLASSTEYSDERAVLQADVYSGADGTLLCRVTPNAVAGEVSDQPARDATTEQPTPTERDDGVLRITLEPLGLRSQFFGLSEDLDGDGMRDLAMWEHVRPPFLVSTSKREAPKAPAATPVLTFRSSRNFTVLRRLPIPDARFVTGVTPVGDLNADGQEDYLVVWVNNCIYVVNGADGSLMKTWSYRSGYWHQEGSSFGACGDLNGDEVPGFFYAANETGIDCDIGFCKVVSGADFSLLRQHDPISKWHGLDGTTIQDLDEDGARELVVAEPWARQVIAYSGASDTVLWARSFDDPAVRVAFENRKRGAAREQPAKRRRTSSTVGKARSTFPTAISDIGDADGDGLSDVLVSDAVFSWSSRQPGIGLLHGRVWLLSGEDRSTIWAVSSEQLRDGFGTSLQRVPDTDGDGVDDCLVGTNQLRPGESNYALLLSGRTGETLDRLEGVASGRNLQRSRIAVGDLDADGVPDRAAHSGGSLQSNYLGAELSFTSGRDGAPLFTLKGHAERGHPCPTVHDAADVNGDGHADVAITRYSADAVSIEVVSGKDGGLIWSQSTQSGRGIVGSALDLDGDGAREIPIERDGGIAFLSCVDGKTVREWSVERTAELVAIGDVNDDGVIDFLMPDELWGINHGRVNALSVADSTVIYRVAGDSARGDDVWHFGAKLVTVGDLNADGYADFVVGGMHVRSGTRGKVWFYSGRDGELLGTYQREGDDVVPYDSRSSRAHKSE